MNAKQEIIVELFLDYEDIGDFAVGDTPKSLHILYDLPGSRGIKLLFDERIRPPDGSAVPLSIGHVFQMAVRGGASAHRLVSGLSGEKTKGEGHYDSPFTFDIAINGRILATVGNPSRGGLSIVLAAAPRGEQTMIALHATGSDENGFRHWAFPLLQSGDLAEIRIAGPGRADEPGQFEPKRHSWWRSFFGRA
jgi:hypothetical protein